MWPINICMIKYPFCSSPSVRAYVQPNGFYRNCCATTPALVSQTQDFRVWWEEELHPFRQELQQQRFPASCAGCEQQEQAGDSYRLALNRANPEINAAHPREWSINFGNVCNLACWTCDEEYSSTIEAHKRKINILPESYQNQNSNFEQAWPALRENIIASYEYHNNVTISILGGEPTYNPLVIEFLAWLAANGYAPRTKLEITTNGTRTNNHFNTVLESPWRYVYIAVSTDATGIHAEWLRYGCRWADVAENIRHYRNRADYVELHCTLSVLNLEALPDLHDFAKTVNTQLVIMPLQNPSHMSLAAWDGEQFVLDASAFEQRGLDPYLDMLGQHAIKGSRERLVSYLDLLGKNRPSQLKTVAGILLNTQAP